MNYEGLYDSKGTEVTTLGASLSERYKGRQIPEFKVSLKWGNVWPLRDGSSDLRARSNPASLLSVLTKAGRTPNSFAMLRKCACCLSLEVKVLR